MPSLDNYHLQRIDAFAIERVWEQVSPLIQDAIDESDQEYKLSDIKKWILENSMQLWVIFLNNDKICAAFVTGILNNGEKLVILFCGGDDLMKWQELFHGILRWGKDNGCRSCEVHGRLGWEKILNSFGFKRKKILLSKNL